jgi:hypothetical protein
MTYYAGRPEDCFLDDTNDKCFGPMPSYYGLTWRFANLDHWTVSYGSLPFDARLADGEADGAGRAVGGVVHHDEGAGTGYVAAAPAVPGLARGPTQISALAWSAAGWRAAPLLATCSAH